MSTMQLSTPAHEEQIAEIVGRLQQRYPGKQISKAELERRVREVHRQFNGARIRSFVAVFAERLVRRSIDEASRTAPHATAGPQPGTASAR